MAEDVKEAGKPHSHEGHIHLGKPKHGCGFHCIKIKDFGVTMGGDTILTDINMHIHCGDFTAIIGRNGAGKSTFLRALLGEIPHDGEIEFTDLLKHERKQIKIGYVPQKLSIDRNTPTSVYDLCAEMSEWSPVFLFRRRETYRKVKEHLAVFQAEDLIDKPVSELSGGELQRVLLSLATMPVPNLLVLDEPAAGIDQNGIRTFYRTLDRIKDSYDLAIIIVSHYLEYVRKYADQVVLLDKTIVRQGTAEEVFNSPEYREIFGA